MLPTNIENIRTEYARNAQIMKNAKHQLNLLLKYTGVGLGTIVQINAYLRQIKSCREAMQSLKAKHNRLYVQYKQSSNVSQPAPKSVKLTREEANDLVHQLINALEQWPTSAKNLEISF